jgi:hypothetical protein
MNGGIQIRPPGPDVKNILIQRLRQNAAQPGTFGHTVQLEKRFAVINQM